MDPGKLGLTLRDLMRYGFTGFLAVMVAAVLAPAETQRLIAVLGGVLSPLVAIALGAILYSVHRVAVVEWFVEPISYCLHWAVNGVRRFFKLEITSGRLYLAREFPEIHWYNSLAALRRVRHSLMDDKLRERISVQASEGHLIYFAASLSAVAWLVARFARINSALLPREQLAPWFLYGALVLLVAGVRSTFMLSSEYASLMQTSNPAALRDAVLGKVQLPDAAQQALP